MVRHATLPAGRSDPGGVAAEQPAPRRPPNSRRPDHHVGDGRPREAVAGQRAAGDLADAVHRGELGDRLQTCGRTSSGTNSPPNMASTARTGPRICITFSAGAQVADEQAERGEHQRAEPGREARAAARRAPASRTPAERADQRTRPRTATRPRVIAVSELGRARTPSGVSGVSRSCRLQPCGAFDGDHAAAAGGGHHRAVHGQADHDVRRRPAAVVAASGPFCGRPNSRKNTAGMISVKITVRRLRSTRRSSMPEQAQA